MKYRSLLNLNLCNKCAYKIQMVAKKFSQNRSKTDYYIKSEPVLYNKWWFTCLLIILV